METEGFFEQIFMWLGPFKYLLILVALIVIVLIVKKVIELFFLKNLSEERQRSGINSILFWGGFGLALGIFAQLSGLWVALQEIIHASDISPAIVIIGFLGSFVSTLAGLFILMVASLSWWLLRIKLRALQNKG